MKQLYILLFLIGISPLAKATHIIGGEIYYSCVGPSGTNSSIYDITIKLYRDCSPSATDFDQTITLAIYNGNNPNRTTETFTLGPKSIVPVVVNNPCVVSLPQVCIEQASYSKQITLSNSSNPYTLSYARCCRSPIVDNLVFPGTAGQGLTLTTNIPPNVGCNSSAAFNSFPPIATCANLPFTFNSAATDVNGDSLVYSLCAPFDGASAGNPTSIATPPPYSPVGFISPYTATNPLPANPAFTINSQTGLITGTPTMIGTYVIGVCVSEYRNGVLLNTLRRDFSISTANCNLQIVSAAQEQTSNCEDLTVQFTNRSTGASSYKWDFGVAGTLADTSRQRNPTYTYADTGTYTITVIAEPGAPCGDTSTVEFRVYGALNPNFNAGVQCINSNSFNFTPTGVYSNFATFKWDFGTGSTPRNSNNKTVNNVNFSGAGMHPVQLITKQGQCFDTLVKNIELAPPPIAKFGFTQLDSCTPATVRFRDSSITDPAAAGIRYLWDFGDGTTSTQRNPNKVYTKGGTFNVTLKIHQTNRCTDTVSYTISNAFTIFETPIADFSFTGKRCLDSNSITFDTLGNFPPSTTFRWRFGNRASIKTSTRPRNVVSFDTAGVFMVTLIVKNGDCVDSISKAVEIRANPIAKFGIVLNNDSCSPVTVRFRDSSYTDANATGYLWDFGDGTTSTNKNPTKVYNKGGLFDVTLRIDHKDGCIDTSYATKFAAVRVIETPKVDFSFEGNQCLDSNLILFDTVGNYTSNANFLWNFGINADVLSGTTPRNSIHFNSAGQQIIQLVVEQEGCSDSLSKIIEIFENPVANYIFSPTEICVPDFVQFTNLSTAASPLEYLWVFGNGDSSTLRNPRIYFDSAGSYFVLLRVNTTSQCIDTSYYSVDAPLNVYPTPTAGYILSDTALPLKKATFIITDTSSGWNTRTLYLGNGALSFDSITTYTYLAPGLYDLIQIAENQFGCSDTMRNKLNVYEVFEFIMPNTFTPNGDGSYDLLRPYTCGVVEYSLTIYDRWGLKKFQTKDLMIAWDGTVDGYKVDVGTYFYIAEVKDFAGRSHQFKGTINLFR